MGRTCENEILSHAVVRVDIVEKADNIIGGPRLEEEGFRTRGKDVDGDLKALRQSEQQKMTPRRNPQKLAVRCARRKLEEKLVLAGLPMFKAIVQKSP